jgi:hypothetical protein
MTTVPKVVFLFDVDNTLLDNDRVEQDLRQHLKSTFSPRARDRYFEIFEELRRELGYTDYLGALERYRLEQLHDPRILILLAGGPFRERLYPRALELARHMQRWGPTVILSDGDAVFQPHKVERSGLDHVLIFVHKEERWRDVELFYPADHYVMVDDKLRILRAIKKIWRERVTTVFPRQGHYANDPMIPANPPDADIQVPAIGDLLNYNLAAYLGN